MINYYHHVLLKYIFKTRVLVLKKKRHLFKEQPPELAYTIGWLPVLWKYCQKRNQATLREVEHLDFILFGWSQMSSHSKFWALNNEFTGFLKGSAGHQVTRNVLVINRLASVGLEIQSCLDKGSRGDLSWKVCLQKETKEGRNEQLSLHGAFCLGPEITS
jgi:hypothetical protein